MKKAEKKQMLIYGRYMQVCNIENSRGAKCSFGSFCFALIGGNEDKTKTAFLVDNFEFI